MFNFLKRDKNTPKEAIETSESKAQTTLLNRLKQGLQRTRTGLTEGLTTLLSGKKEIAPDLLEQIEEQLLISDVGIETTQSIVKKLTQSVSRKELSNTEAVFNALKQYLIELIKPCEQPFITNTPQLPFVILMIGINGAGKTTTIGKIAKKFQAQGKKIMLAAGDTFRAAAIEQLQIWGKRNDIPVISQHTGADSASVIFDAFQAAKARNIDILIADTAGRLHTKNNLMEELKKIKRILSKIDPEAPHEVMLVLDAGTGQNALNQAKQFHESIGITGLTITKLDGTAKGGMIFSIANQLNLPIRYIGIGESIDDLREFSAEDFISALFE